MELLENYKKEITLDVKIDQLNILDRQMMLPAVKHKWVSRLIDAKQSLNRLNKKKKETRRQVLEALEGNLPKGLPKTALDSKIEASEKMQTINDEIDETELMIVYLEKVEKIFTEMNFGIKNCVDLIKMETT
jgi:septation ring formation regulator EzrA